MSQNSIKTRHEAAEILRVSVFTIDRLGKRGAIPRVFLSPGKKPRIGFLQSDLDAYIERQRQNAAQ